MMEVLITALLGANKGANGIEFVAWVIIMCKTGVLRNFFNSL